MRINLKCASLPRRKLTSQLRVQRDFLATVVQCFNFWRTRRKTFSAQDFETLCLVMLSKQLELEPRYLDKRPGPGHLKRDVHGSLVRPREPHRGAPEFIGSRPRLIRIMNGIYSAFLF